MSDRSSILGNAFLTDLTSFGIETALNGDPKWNLDPWPECLARRTKIAEEYLTTLGLGGLTCLKIQVEADENPEDATRWELAERVGLVAGSRRPHVIPLIKVLGPCRCGEISDARTIGDPNRAGDLVYAR